MSRIVSRQNDDKPEIDKEAVIYFFDQRAQKASQLGNVGSMCYQDKNPELALQRDKAEKALLYPMLQIDKDTMVLDAGCGVGRWAEMITPHCSFYHGVDGNAALIEIATKNHAAANAEFSVCPLEELSASRIGDTRMFNRIMSFGVYHYMNDGDMMQMLRALAGMAAPRARFLLRGPIAMENRLTLKEHFSDDMQQMYNAIYRTEAELKTMFAEILGKQGFRLDSQGDVYGDAALNNRAETKQQWFLMLRD